MKICIPPILCRRSFPWFTVLACGIYFGAPNKKEFQNIVTTLAERYGVTMPAEELLMKANAWELSHGGLTGRTAQQFIDHATGNEAEEQDKRIPEIILKFIPVQPNSGEI